MDFPQFFQRPSRFQSITTRWYRGLSVLTQDPTRQYNETIQPVTGECFSDNDIPIHVISKPFVAIAGTPTLAAATLLPAKPGVRYFIHNIILSARLLAGDTTTVVNVAATFRTAGSSIASLAVVPSVAAAYNGSFNLDVITDENTAVIGNCVVADPTFARAFLIYSEVGAAQ